MLRYREKNTPVFLGLLEEQENMLRPGRSKLEGENLKGGSAFGEKKME